MTAGTGSSSSSTNKSDAEYVSVPVTDEDVPLQGQEETQQILPASARTAGIGGIATKATSGAGGASLSAAAKSSSQTGWWQSWSAWDWQALLFLLLALMLVAYQNDWKAGPGLLSSAPSCKGLLLDGQWLASGRSPLQTWQPAGCYKYTYQAKDPLATCFSHHQEVLIVGDSSARAVFVALAKLVDPSWTLNDKTSHSDHQVQASTAKLRVRFMWDPFLNRTVGAPSTAAETKVDLLYIRGGYWHLKESASPQAARQALLPHLQTIGKRAATLADKIYVSLLPPVVESKLAPSRQRITNKGVDAVNAAIWQTLGPPDALNSEPGHGDYVSRFSNLYVPLSTYRLYADVSSQLTTDGLHYEAKVAQQEVDILLNHACNAKLHANDMLPKGTCCNAYRPFDWKQYSTILFLFLAGTLAWSLRSIHERMAFSATSLFGRWIKTLPTSATLHALTTLSLVLAYVLLADRAGFFVKSAKTWNAPVFAGLMGLLLVAGAWTWQRNTSGSGFLNREQTDEWKGWMQVVILVYHFTGASSVMAVYNLIRVMVAAYLFMTGYGHFTYFYKKGDFSLHRSLSVLLRLNLLTVLLTMTTNLDYLSYYFSPLTSLWYGVIWVTMRIQPDWKGKWSLLKIGIATIVVTLAVSWEAPTRWVIESCNMVIGSQWNAREWLFRVALDKWIVFFGMTVAYLYIHYDEMLAAPAQKVPSALTSPVLHVSLLITSGVAYILFSSYGFESKFDYNGHHPFLSLLTVTLFVLTRNVSKTLRSGHSSFFAFFGRCSLETFILQYHIFLSMDTRGILMIVPNSDLLGWTLNFIITSIIFVWVSDKAAKATNVLCAAIIGPKPKGDASARWQGWHLLLVFAAVAVWNHLPTPH